MIILGLSGKKQSGKDSCAEFLKENAELLFGPGKSVEIYHFGGAMKLLAEKFFGVERHKLWGTNEQKNELTHIRWENLPNYVMIEHRRRETEFKNFKTRSGPMTGRQFLQWIGEEAFLAMDPAIWTRYLRRELEEEMRYGATDVAVIADIRKPEQVATVKFLGGLMVRLTRDVFRDQHVSETALDPQHYDQANFDLVIHNEHLTPAQRNQELRSWLLSLPQPQAA